MDVGKRKGKSSGLSEETRDLLEKEADAERVKQQAREKVAKIDRVRRLAINAAKRIIVINGRHEAVQNRLGPDDHPPEGLPDRPAILPLRACGKPDWQEGNKALCRYWVLRDWVPLCAAVTDAEIIDIAKAWKPESGYQCEIASKFLGLLEGAAPKKTAEDLAEVREALREKRFELPKYFGGLARMVARHAAPRHRQLPSTTNAADTEHLSASAENVADTSAPDTQGSAAQDDDIAHGSDFSWMRVRGELFQFKKGQQARAIGALFEEWKCAGRQDGCGLSEETIAECLGSKTGKVRFQELFRGHPALGAILRSVTKGVYALFLNSTAGDE